MTEGLIYLASPYSNPDQGIVDHRFHAACRASARLMGMGYLIFSPIAHTHPIAQEGQLPTGWDFWQRYDYAMLSACRQLWVLQLDGWDKSKGVAAEIRFMRRRNEHIAYVSEDLMIQNEYPDSNGGWGSDIPRELRPANAPATQRPARGADAP